MVDICSSMTFKHSDSNIRRYITDYRLLSPGFTSVHCLTEPTLSCYGFTKSLTSLLSEHNLVFLYTVFEFEQIFKAKGTLAYFCFSSALPHCLRV